MKCLVAAFGIAVATMLTPVRATAQSDNSSPIYLFSKVQAEFDQSVKEVLFPWNDHTSPTDQAPLQSNAQWLKEHPDIYFYVDGYASTRGVGAGRHGDLLVAHDPGQRTSDHHGAGQSGPPRRAPDDR